MLDSMKTDAGLLSGEGTSINDDFADLSKQVDELMLKVDTQVAIEGAKLEERIAETQSASTPEDVEELFNGDVDVSGTLGNIDKWLSEDDE